MSVAMLTGCSENYLELAPETQPTPELLMSTIDNAKYAINGLGRLMSEQYIGTQGFSGEGGMIVWYGEFPGNDMIHNRYNSTWYNYANLNYSQRVDHTASAYAWIYNYKMIANANVIINNVDNATGEEKVEETIKFIKAQALTFRANAYLWLVQTYSKRWCDSNNGQSRGVVIRLGDEPDDLECSTVAETYAQIYSDLELAIKLFQESGMDRGSNSDDVWEPNEAVAHAVFARAALTREDWSTANTQAELACKDFPLMTSDEYRAGFNTANSEWIWMLFSDTTQTLSYYTPFAYLATNATGSVTRGYGNVISNKLVEQIPEEDTRLWLYGIPQEGDNNTINTSSTPGRITKGGLFDRYQNEYYDRYSHDPEMTRYFAYAVMKFLKKEGIAEGCFVLYRSAEMYYTRAEALYELGRQDEARAILIEAVKPYQENYDCTLTGEALRDEIRLYRRFDLLGEGHNFYDFKRWKLPVTRSSWADGGTWPDVFCGDGHNGGTGGNFGPNDKNNWCFVIPEEELNFNKCVNYGKEPDNWTKGFEVSNSGE